MLELTKTVLDKVSFDKSLFKKELLKATKWLHKEDLLLLQAWCVAKYASTHQDLILEAFQSIS